MLGLLSGPLAKITTAWHDFYILVYQVCLVKLNIYVTMISDLYGLISECMGFLKIFIIYIQVKV